MGFLKEFKAFALKGNVMDMAVGVIIGASFKAIVDSLVADIDAQEQAEKKAEGRE